MVYVEDTIFIGMLVWIKMIPCFILKLLIKRNYRLRELGRLPDEWYWADIELMHRGKFMNYFNLVEGN